MQATHVSTTLLLGLLGLSACDSELDEQNFDDEDLEFAETESDPSLTPMNAELEPMDGLPPLDPDQLPPDEIEATNTEQTVSCDLGLPSNITANWYNWKTATGVLSGLGSGFYTLELHRNQGIYNLHLWQAWMDGVWLGSNAGTEGHTGAFSAGPGDVLDLELRAEIGAQPGWSYPIDVELYSYPNHQLICSDTITMTIPTGCIGVGWWYQNPFPTPWDDGANCMVATLPQGAQGFMYQGSWYVTPTNGNQCSIGSFDGANCYIGIAPMNRIGFIWQQKLYYNRI